MHAPLNIFTPTEYAEIKKLCSMRDYRFSKLFYNQPFFNVVSPLFDSIQLDGSMSLFVGKATDKSPEATATAILALHRINVLPKSILIKVQDYLINSNFEVVRLKAISNKEIKYEDISIENCAWSALEGRNVWSTSQILWTLIGTGYDGNYMFILDGSTEWLLGQQYKDGGWSFSAYKDNNSNVYITALALNALRLSKERTGVSSQMQRKIQTAIVKGIKYIIDNRLPNKKYWGDPIETKGSEEIEPTTTAIAIWALKYCISSSEEINNIIKDGIIALKQDIADKQLWHNKVTVDQFVPDTENNKTGHGFSLSIPMILLRLGVDPNDEVVLKVMNLALNAKLSNGWEFYSTVSKDKTITGFNNPLTNYVGVGQAMTFTTGLVLWMVEEWHRALLTESVSSKFKNRTFEISLAKKKLFLSVSKKQLGLLLLASGTISICLYLFLLSYIFKTPISDVVSGLNLNDFSDTLDGVVKLLFVPVIIILLGFNFYRYGSFSFRILRDGWRRIFY